MIGIPPSQERVNPTCLSQDSEPVEGLTVLSNVEGLTILSEVEGESRNVFGSYIENSHKELPLRVIGQNKK